MQSESNIAYQNDVERGEEKIEILYTNKKKKAGFLSRGGGNVKRVETKMSKNGWL